MQIKNSFDKETLNKILRGSGYAALSAGMIYFLQFTGMDFKEASALATSGIMALIGVIKFLQTADWKKIINGVGLAVGSSVAIYLLELIPDLDLGDIQPLATAIAAVLLNSLKEYKAGN